VRLIDALGARIRLGVEIREPAIHDRVRRADHRDGEAPRRHRGLSREIRAALVHRYRGL
jgi:hypothetical protein